MLALMIVLGVQAQLAVSPIDAIPALGAKLSVDDAMLPLSDLTAKLESATKVRLSVSKEIADRKVGAFFTDRPASEVMRRLESTLFVEWEPDGAGLKLVLPSETKAQERSMIAADREALRKVLTSKLTAWADASREPYESEKQRIKELQGSYSDLEKDTSPSGKRRAQDALAQLIDLGGLQYSRQFWDLGSVLSNYGPDAVDTVLSGQAIAASNDPMQGSVRMGPDANPTGSSPIPAHYLTFLFFEPASARLTVTTHSVSGSTSGGGVWFSSFDMRSDRRIGDELRKEPLYKRLEAWKKADDNPVLDTPIASGVKLPQPWLQGTLTASDQLSWLSHSTGIPILCDAYRVPATYNHIIAAATVRAWLPDLGSQEGSSQIAVNRGVVRTEGGWLLYRPASYWRYLDSEIPERVLRPLERADAEMPSFEEYAKFAAGLSPEQESRIDPSHIVTRFPLKPLVGNIPIMRLWQSLSDSERRRALKGFLSASDMSTSSRQLYLEALYQLGYKAGVPDRYLAALLPNVPLPGGMGLSAIAATDTGGFNTNTAEQLLEPDSNGIIMSGNMYHYADVFLFRLGVEGGGSINYTVPTSAAK
jgi:hypothetical protein